MHLIKELTSAFRAKANPEIAVRQHAYMKEHFPYHGIQKPLRAELQKKLFLQYPIRSEEALADATLKLWELPEREFQYAALDLWEKYRKLVSAESFSTIEHLIRTKSWWDTVDDLSGDILGSLLRKEPTLKKTMEQWIDDPDMWIRRSALLFQLKYKADTDEETLFRFCQKRMGEKEFFIRKAIGWVLREYAKTEPSRVAKFLQRHRSSLSGLSYREASKHLSF
jgi:3-methyladenine DNA glycosylase AlkD